MLALSAVLASGIGILHESSRKCGNPALHTQSRLLAFRVGGTAKYPPVATIERVEKPRMPKMNPDLAERGAIIADGFGCSICHGYSAETPGGTGPDLRRNTPPNLAAFKSIVQDGTLSAAGMPRFRDISDQQAESIYAWIVHSSWELYSSQK
jgi:quinohemoprotein ethanol dehydrogenase